MSQNFIIAKHGKIIISSAIDIIFLSLAYMPGIPLVSLNKKILINNLETIRKGRN